MKTIILPGYSPHNRIWAEEIGAGLVMAEVHYWRHWETGGRMDPVEELKAIQQQIGNGPVSILAKSVGCRLAIHTTLRNPGKVDKVLFCGIPSTDQETIADLEKFFTVLPAQRILVIQNNADPYAPFAEVNRVFQERQPQIQVLERDRDDHHYPYLKDFKAFLLPE